MGASAMKHKSVADIAYEILSKHEKPLHYRKITEELIKVKPLKVKEPYYTVNASMSGDKRFIRTKRGIWGLVKWKYKDANIKYSLTSYCLKDGTMFLTSYMRPFFPKDKKIIEITFIDKEGIEIEALVNNELNCIIGLKDWYRKKNLKVNDIVFIGLIDYDRRKYFLVTENETLAEPQEDLGEKIFNALEKEGRPLSFKEICERVLEVETKGSNLFYKYIADILKRDSRFAEEKNNFWGLFDWLSDAEKLKIELIKTEDNRKYKKLIQKAFNFLGYETSLVAEGRASFILAKAHLDYKTYNLIIDGKLLDNQSKRIQKYEFWDELEEAKEKYKADFSIIISTDFNYEKLNKKIEEYKVVLFELRWLDSLIKEHNRLPFSLSDLKLIFLDNDTIENNINELIEKRESIYYKIKLINIMIRVLNENNGKKLYLNLESLTKIINQKFTEHFEFKKVAESEIEETAKILSLEPFNILQTTEMGSIILNFKPELAKQRLEKIISEMF